MNSYTKGCNEGTNSEAVIQNRRTSIALRVKAERQTCCYSIALVCMVVLNVLCGGCTSKSDVENRQQAKPERTNRVMVASYALQYLTQRLVGDAIKVEFPAGSTQDPANWSPSVEEIASMQRADLVVVNGSGAPFAQWLVQVTLPAGKICESCEDVPLSKLIAVPDYRIVHSHGPEGEHSHAYMVPHTWLDPELAALQAKKIAECLEQAYVEHGPAIKNNLAALLQDLSEIKKPAESDSNQQKLALVTASPEMKYLTRFAGFEDKHVLWFDKLAIENKDLAINKIQEKMSESTIRAVVCDSTPSENLKEFCTSNDCRLIQMNLLEFEPASGDFLTELQANIRKLSELNTSSN